MSAIPIGLLIRTSLLAGLVAAAVEMAFVLPIQAMLGASPTIVFQSIASGALGRAAFAEGLGSAGLGLLVHILISVVAATLFVFAAIRWPVLIRRPGLSGPAFGIIVYLVMNFVVIPISAIGFHLPKSAFLGFVSFAIHLVAFGLPISLVTAAMLRREASAGVG